MVVGYYASPVFWIAVGSALGFYFIGHFSGIGIITIGLLLVILLSFSRATIYLSIFAYESNKDKNNKNSRKLKIILRSLTLFIVGIVIGINSLEKANILVNLGIKKENIKSINGILL